MNLDHAVKEFEYSRLPRAHRILLLLEYLNTVELGSISRGIDPYVDSNFTKLPGSLDAAPQV